MTASRPLAFRVEPRIKRAFTWGDLLALGLIAVLVFVGARLAFGAPQVIVGPQISLSPNALPWYTLFSLGRMLAAYALSMVFTLFYGRAAAYNRYAEMVLMPLLDVLQSVPILSFLPVVLLSLSVILPQNFAAELASIVLIFTSQAWNLTFAWYQSLTTIPKELREASSIFRLNSWLRFKRLEFPFATISLVWNSIMSWAGGWFFLMAAESFTVGNRDFRLPGLGSYLHEAANQGDHRAILLGILTLILTILILDQMLWRPLLAWAAHFKLETIESGERVSSWFYDAIRNARIVCWLSEKLFDPITESIDRWMLHISPPVGNVNDAKRTPSRWFVVPAAILAFVLLYGLYHAAIMLLQVPLNQWGSIGLGLVVTFLRVALSLGLATVWTVPVGVLIGTNRRLATVLQPLVQITASVPATALFPVVLLIVLRLPMGLNFAAILLMLMGTQWYLLFNTIAGASAIPQDLKYTTDLLQLSSRERWRTLILPAIFPYFITGAITASGGAWNASIVAEYVVFGGKTLKTIGIGALIAQATANGDYPLLLAATLSMVVAVILVNRLVWRRLYVIAEDKYRME